jgi:hypothetical protein
MEVSIPSSRVQESLLREGFFATVYCSISMEVTFLGFEHVTLLPSKGCSSPNSLTVLPLFRVFCWQRLHLVLLFLSRLFVVFFRVLPPPSFCFDV